jgi:hypothetical protein
MPTQKEWQAAVNEAMKFPKQYPRKKVPKRIPKRKPMTCHPVRVAGLSREFLDEAFSEVDDS